MRKIWLATCALAVGAALPFNALAQSNNGGLAPFVGVGLTFGGEDLATAQFSNGTSQTVTTGGLLDLRFGLEYRLIGQPIAIQGVVAYHVDATNATNGDLRFTRIPVELIAMYDIGSQWRVGLGMRKATGAKVTASGDATGAGFGSSTNFDSNLGFLAVAEYKVTPQVGLQLRYVNESYKVKLPTSQPKVDGSHAGIFGIFYFK
ncbi:MAG TPA: outer membrane beta-barrel protein [Aquabacterium sp.]|nr:outer membrane beta-barrel protein [Aquabacterium sp.]